MEVIALRLSDIKLPSGTGYDNTIAANLQQNFETIKYFPPSSNVTYEQGVLNNGRQFQHLLYSHLEHEITVSTNELNAVSLAFLREFWKAQYKYISIYETANFGWSSYRAVRTEGGLFPISYIEDIIHLPELTLKLIEINPEQ